MLRRATCGDIDSLGVCKSNDCELSVPPKRDGKEEHGERNGVIHKVNRLCACVGPLTAGQLI